MFGWALFFLVMMLASGVFGFSDIAGAPYHVGKILFFTFMGLLVITLFTTRGKISPSAP
jgi:uncharacterized membrane protein YtjA (UPF0391 family)